MRHARTALFALSTLLAACGPLRADSDSDAAAALALALALRKPQAPKPPEPVKEPCPCSAQCVCPNCKAGRGPAAPRCDCNDRKGVPAPHHQTAAPVFQPSYAPVFAPYYGGASCGPRG